jgi:PEP-CTERM motif
MGRIKMLAALVRWSFALTLLCSVSWAQAALLVTYTFQDVLFDDGGTLSGWASFDPTQFGVARDPPFPDVIFDVRTTAGTSNVASHEYISTPTNSTGGGVFSPFVENGIYEGAISLYANYADGHVLWIFLRFAGPTLADRIGRVSITTQSEERDVVRASDGTLSSPERFVVSGTAYGVVVSVPEPNTYAMILAGLVLIGAISAKARR